MESGSESRFDTTEIYADEVRDVGDLDESMAAMVEYLVAHPGSRFGVVRDGRVTAVIVDRADASIFEHLQVRYHDEPGEHLARQPRVSQATIENERRRESDI